MRVGIGYDVHRLVKNRKLILGGVEIPFDKGLMGHSDADVLVHAICDALLGAAGLGDIGRHFPDSDQRFKDVYSIKLLEKTFKMINEKGLSIINIDTVIFAEAPKLSPYEKDMREILSHTLALPADCLNIKATTTEGLGMIGKGDGIAAMCIVMLKQTD
jgi:2-C-methyl-D-erythritol 2,4-cyclodiphosphate synthase